ncbi:MAG TPA: tetratricopeptide repeat protein [Anaerolineae bacterium]|nr:tetratricopeptide repeat protein [Anaerolineae bacterium]
MTLDPTYAEAYAYLAEAQIDAGNWFAANDTIATALQLDKDNVEVLRNYGYVYEVQGNYSAAIEAYRQALQRQPNLAHLYIAIGRNQHVLGNFTQAQESYTAATEVDPTNLMALERAGLLHLLQGDYGPAQVFFQKALEVDPTYSRALGRLGTLYFQRRNYEDAIPALESAIRYGEMESRRRAVFFVITEEPQGAALTAPTGRTVARGEFVFPEDARSPLRAMLQGTTGQENVKGYLRLDPLDGRYTLSLQGASPAAAGQTYIGWFQPLLAPGGDVIHTAPLRVEADGSVTASGTTGVVKGAPIETYYTLSLCYYYLNRCEDARPYIAVALRLDPQDANALQTQRLCGGQ